MLAGILIAALLVAGLAFAIPWISSQRPNNDELEEEPTERFSQSMRILKRDVIDYGDPSAVSTPLTRASELYGVRMSARQAAQRRLTVLSILVGFAVVLGVLAGFSLLPWWSFLIPTGLAITFLGVARYTVVGMHRRLDACAASIEAGFDEDEDTEVIDLTEEQSNSTEYSIDLTAPQDRGVFWDPIPVSAATYVQQPLMPRTVRTIDLSAPVATSMPLVPTADHPDDVVDEESVELRRVVGE